MNIDILKDKLNTWNFDTNILNHQDMFKASVLVPLVFLDNKIQIIFQVRAKNIRQGGEISFPGGRVDKSDKDFAETAIRETNEELGVDPCNILLKGQLDTLVSPFNSIIRAYIGILNINSIEELDINKDEVERLLMIPLDWFYQNPPQQYRIYLESHPYTKDANGNKVFTFPAKELGLPETYHDSWLGKPRDVYLYEYDGEKIWGFTALILMDALKKLEILGLKKEGV